jgi:hypothetical protein
MTIERVRSLERVNTTRNSPASTCAVGEIPTGSFVNSISAIGIADEFSRMQRTADRPGHECLRRPGRPRSQNPEQSAIRPMSASFMAPTSPGPFIVRPEFRFEMLRTWWCAGFVGSICVDWRRGVCAGGAGVVRLAAERRNQASRRRRASEPAPTPAVMQRSPWRTIIPVTTRSALIIPRPMRHRRT